MKIEEENGIRAVDGGSKLDHFRLVGRLNWEERGDRKGLTTECWKKFSCWSEKLVLGNANS